MMSLFVTLGVCLVMLTTAAPAAHAVRAVPKGNRDYLVARQSLIDAFHSKLVKKVHEKERVNPASLAKLLNGAAKNLNHGNRKVVPHKLRRVELDNDMVKFFADDSARVLSKKLISHKADAAPMPSAMLAASKAGNRNDHTRFLRLKVSKSDKVDEKSKDIAALLELLAKQRKEKK